MSPQQQKKDKRQISGGAIAGAGGVTAAGGLVGGGIPGFKSNSSTIGNIRQGSAAQRVGAAASSLRGGIFGYRTDAHKGFLQRQENDEKYFKDKPANRKDMYHRGVGSGKIGPEKEIIRHMKAGKKASGVALVGGAAATAYGVHRAKQQKVSKAYEKVKHRSDATNAGLVAGGSTAAAGSYGGARFMESQGRKWAARSGASHAEAKKVIPNLGGAKETHNPRYAPNPRVPNQIPEKGHKLVDNDKKLLAGKSKAQANAAGALRGAADQHAYFSGVYGKTALMARKGVKPSLAVAGLGAAGLGATHAKDEWNKKHVSKRGRIMSDAEVKRRKKLQGHISQTTSTLGLAGLGVTGAAALAAKKPGALRAVQKIPKLRETTPEKMKNAAINTGIVSGGISGVGGYNFASYTNAESRKRTVPKQQPVRKQYEQIEMGYYGEEGHPVKLEKIVVPIEKAWSPEASNYDSERNRQNRHKAYKGGALVAAGASGAYAGSQGLKAVASPKAHVRPLEYGPMAVTRYEKDPATNKVTRKTSNAVTNIHQAAKQTDVESHLKALKGANKVRRAHAGKAALGVAGVAAAAGAHKAIKNREKKSWQPYAKRDDSGRSAFGIDHAH